MLQPQDMSQQRHVQAIDQDFDNGQGQIQVHILKKLHSSSMKGGLLESFLVVKGSQSVAERGGSAVEVASGIRRKRLKTERRAAPC